jgi:hypothetical protein
LKSFSSNLNRISSPVKLTPHPKTTLCTASSSLYFVLFSCSAGQFRLGRIVPDIATRQWRNNNIIIRSPGCIVLNSGSISSPLHRYQPSRIQDRATRNINWVPI